MTGRKDAATFHVGGLAALMAAVLLVPACSGSSSSSHASSAAASTAASSRESRVSARGVAISTAKGPDGTYITGPSGRALYLWVGDSIGKSNCSADCASAWPPLITKATPVPSGGVMAADLGTIMRSDGREQVTYQGHPLYYFAADSGPGTTKGQGSDFSGARWWLVAPTGEPITANGSSSVAPPSGY